MPTSPRPCSLADPTDGGRLTSHRLHWIWSLAAAGMLMVGCGADTTVDETDDNDADENAAHNQGTNQQANQDDVGPDAIADIETVVDASTTTAGEPLDVDCQYLNPTGDPVAVDGDVTADEEILTYPDDAFDAETEDGAPVPVRAGQIEVACQHTGLGLTDFEPPAIEVEPAEAVVTRADLADHQIVAGDTVQASCIGFDRYDNLITDADFELTPDTASGVEVSHQDLTAELTSAGTVGFSCQLDDASDRFGDIVEVLPAEPADLEIAPTPDQPIYNTGQIVTADTLVEDQYGNRISNPEIDYDGGPADDVFGDNRFQYFVEGTHTVSAQITGPTYQDQELVEDFEVVVNETGPDISCVEPANGEMVDAEPGDQMPLEGVVSDDYDVDEVTVEGKAIDLNTDGSFETTTNVRYGINFVDITATDEYGEQNVHTCAFMASDNWHDQDDEIDEGVALQLDQNAVDDGEYDGSFSWQIESFNDLIQTVLRSYGFEQELADQMYDQSPFEVEIDVYIGSCTYDVHVENFELGTGHTSTLELMDGGLHLVGGDGDVSWNDDTLIHDIHIELDIRHSTCPNYSTEVDIDWISADLEADVNYYSWYDHPEVDLGEVDAETGHISLSGWVGSAIETFAQGTLQDAVESELEDAVSDNFDDLFDDLLASISSYTTTFSVPQLDGSGSIPMDFTVGMAGIDFTDDDAQFELDAEISTDADPDPYIGSKGVPYPDPEGDFLGVPSLIGSDVGGGAHVAMLNQALHQLWRAGLFHASIDGDTISGLDIDLPDGASVELEAQLPPMAVLDDFSDAELMFGALKLHVVYPGIFDEPVTFDVGAVANTDVLMSYDTLEFDDIDIDEFHFSTAHASLDESTHDVLEDFFIALLQDVIDQSVNSALPSIPIPAFEIPSSMYQYGLPSGDMGLVDSDYDQTETHMEITGEFGIQ